MVGLTGSATTLKGTISGGAGDEFEDVPSGSVNVPFTTAMLSRGGIGFPSVWETTYTLGGTICEDD